jgi:hypothetical protein
MGIGWAEKSNFRHRLLARLLLCQLVSEAMVDIAVMAFIFADDND